MLHVHVEYCDEGLLLLVDRMDAVDCVSKLAVLSILRTPGCASVSALGENS